MKLRLLHAADIHLDSPFSGVDSETSRTRREEARHTFRRMMKTASERQCDAILLSGDVFDGERVTRETAEMLYREFAAFERPIFISPGNHDPAGESSLWCTMKFPRNVHIFRERQLTKFDDVLPNTAVYGFAFTDAEMEDVPFQRSAVEDEGKLNILLCHGDIASQSRYCPIREADIIGFGADYTALGHIHNPPPFGEHNRRAYPGCLEPRGFDEVGEKGALIVDIEKNGTQSRVKIEKLTLARQRYERLTVSLDSAYTNAQIREAVESELSRLGCNRDTLADVTLTGTVSEGFTPNSSVIESGIRMVGYITVTDRTRVDLEYTSLEKDITVRGELYRQLKPKLNSADEYTRKTAENAFRYAMSALAGEEI